MGFTIEVWGDYACFTRPELKAERYSYDVMTPSAARGILDAIYWHPGMKWVIDKIYVMNPIKRISITRNEMKDVFTKSNELKKVMAGQQDISALSVNILDPSTRTQRTSSVLKDVRYVIKAHFDIVNNDLTDEDKVCAIVSKRLAASSCFKQPYFGCREFPAFFKRVSDESIKPAKINQDLGLMLYDMDRSNPNNIKPIFFWAQVRDGVMNVW